MNHTVVLRLTYTLTTDSVEIYDVDGSGISLISRFTRGIHGRRETATTYSKFHRLYILFKSNVKTSNAEEGIFASYTAITPGKCTGKLQG